MEKQFQRATAYHGLGATWPFRVPSAPQPARGISGVCRRPAACGVSSRHVQIQDERVCRGKAGTLLPSDPSEHFEGEPGCIQE